MVEHKSLFMTDAKDQGECGVFWSIGVARAFPGGRLAHPEGQNEEKNELKFEKK